MPRDHRHAEAAAQRLRWVRCAVESVYHRHNTSAVLRSCDAFGIQDVHLVGDVHFQPAIGPSRGTGKWLDLHRHAHTTDAVQRIRDDGYALWVADFSERPIAPQQVPLDRPVCVWFGAEVMGVSPEAREAAEGIVTVPMRGLAHSLNVSVAAALVLHTLSERARLERGEAALLPPERRQALLTRWLQRDQEDLDLIDAEDRAAELLAKALRH